MAGCIDGGFVIIAWKSDVMSWVDVEARIVQRLSVLI